MLLPQDRLRHLLTTAITAAYPAVTKIEIAIEPTKDPQHGDFASSVALKLAKQVQQPPQEVAKHILAQLRTPKELTKAEVAGPGFINLFVQPKWLMNFVPKILADKQYGHQAIGHGQKILLEFVSANPTGPVTMGNGRAAFSGDTLANVLAMADWKVVREYYVNDYGNQTDILAESVIRRYFQLQKIPTDYPDYCYQGEYVTELATKLKLDKLKLRDMTTLRDRIKGRILEQMIKDHVRVMKKSQVTYTSWFRESALHRRKLTDKMIEYLRRHGLLYAKDGATWFKTTVFGDDKDRVLLKKDGKAAYLVADVALRWNRFMERHVDREIIFLGADHHGYTGRLNAIAAALGHAGDIEVILIQLVRLMRDGQEVKMSKRAGTFVTLEEVIDEVGLDATRFFFLMHDLNSHMDFDLNLAKERSEKNPVYYVQYAHARIANILKKTGRLPRIAPPEPPHTSELNLAKALLQFPVVLEHVAKSYETQKLPFYATELATRFHEFYTHCRVIDQGQVWQSRLTLVQATQNVLSRTLNLMGITAPEKM